ncbi:hypothetical protein MRB53_010029 [Persea americana]|uniref:Uncharacterized protein n=1 Tax=Persea americana TaxID=3435 RepID=A0ACC2LRP9_PERAE|nr:hypothetical protein MRB53_010029 [Persea americana]
MKIEILIVDESSKVGDDSLTLDGYDADGSYSDSDVWIFYSSNRENIRSYEYVSEEDEVWAHDDVARREIKAKGIIHTMSHMPRPVGPLDPLDPIPWCFAGGPRSPQEIEALPRDNDTTWGSDEDVKGLYWPCNMVRIDHENPDKEKNEDEDKAESLSTSEPSNSTSS